MADLTAFATAAAGVSTSPPQTKELLAFVREFVAHYELPWGANRHNRIVVKFTQHFSAGSWLMFWHHLHNEINSSADRAIAARALRDLHTVITYADPTGEQAVRNIMRGLHTQT
jgi:hypothetical protein